MAGNSTALRRLIINADDFGFSPGVTDGILKCHRQGILTSTTLMTTMPDRDRAIALAQETPTLGVGIHLCLTQGTPLTRCSALLDRAGDFPRSLPALFLRLRSDKARGQALEEWSAQVEAARARGLFPTHLDSHKHIHHFPALQNAAIAVAQRFGIHHIRCARELSNAPSLPRASPSYRLLAHIAQKFARRLPAGVTTTDWFYGLASTGRSKEALWLQFAENCPPGTGEFMVHPGFTHDIDATQTRLLSQRSDEMVALLSASVRDALAGRGIALIRYDQLSTS